MEGAVNFLIRFRERPDWPLDVSISCRKNLSIRLWESEE
jgi:hypothetical protein